MNTTHLHVRFKEILPSTGLPDMIPPQPIEYDLDDAWFELIDGTHNGGPVKKIKITPRNQDEFPDSMRILWRFQDSVGFENIDYNTQLGRWPQSNVSLSSFNNLYSRSMKESLKSTIKHLYVVFADSKTGSCVQRYVTIDIDPLKKRKRWTYKRVNDQYIAEGNKK